MAFGRDRYERVEIPLGRLDIRTPDHQAVIGTVRAAKNLCNLGLRDSPYYSPVETADRKGTLSGILALCTSIRQRRGLLSTAQLDSKWYTDGGGTSWEPDDLTSGARRHIGAAVASQRIHLMGGEDAGGVKTTHEKYDPDAGVYASAAAVPSGRASNGVFTFIDPFGDEQIYLMMGWDGAAYTLFGQVYDVETDAWLSNTSSKTTLQGEGAWAYDGAGKFYIASGFSTSILSVYDVKTNTWKETLTAAPAERRYAAGAWQAGKFYVFGGDNTGATAQTTVWAYDPALDTWDTTLAAMPRPRRGALAIEAGGLIYLIGGEQGSGPPAAHLTMDRYDPALDSWTALPVGDDLPTSRSRAAGVTWSGETIIFAIGGEQTLASGIFRVEVEAYVIADGTAPPSFSSANALERLVALTANKIYVIDPSDGAFPHDEVFDFGDSDATRRMQCAQVGESVFMAVVSGEGYGTPERLLELRDDVVIDHHLPSLPVVQIAGSISGADGQGLSPGAYAYRWAYLLKDGSFGPASQPVAISPVPDPSFPDRGVIVTFTIDFFPDALPASFEDVISGVAILMTQELSSIDFTSNFTSGFGTDPFYHVGTIRSTAVGDSVELDLTTERIGGFPLIDDDRLTYHTMLGGAVFAYNKRLILGDVLYDFEPPDALQIVTPVAADGGHNKTRTGDWCVRFGLVIETETGEYERIGPAAGIATAQATGVNLAGERTVGFGGDGWFLSFGSYPDRRVNLLRLYVSSDCSTYVLHTEYKMQQGPNTNICFTDNIGQINITTGEIGTAMPDPAVLSAKKDHDVNRVQISETNLPRSMRAGESYFSGNGPADLVVGFAANALPADQGQFGDFPLLMINRESVMYGRINPQAGALDSFLVEINFVSNDRGCVGRYAFTNVDNVVGFAARDGIWLIRPKLDSIPISEPISNNTTLDDLYACLSFDTALAYHNDKTRGRRELWVAAGSLVFTYAMSYDRWNILERSRRVFEKLNNILYGAQKFVVGNTAGVVLADDGHLFHEHDLSVPIEVYLRTARMTFQEFGGMGLIKRIKRLWVRQDIQMSALSWRLRENDPNGSLVDVATAFIAFGGFDVTYLDAGSVYEPFLEIFGTGLPGQKIEGFGFDFRIKYPHRSPAAMPNTGINQFDGLTISGSVWECALGFVDIEIPPSPALCPDTAVVIGTQAVSTQCPDVGVDLPAFKIFVYIPPT